MDKKELSILETAIDIINEDADTLATYTESEQLTILEATLDILDESDTMARYREKKDNECNGKVEKYNPSEILYRAGKDGKIYESKSYRANTGSESHKSNSTLRTTEGEKDIRNFGNKSSEEECDEYAKQRRKERLDYIQSPDGQLDKIRNIVKRKRAGLDNTEYTKSYRESSLEIIFGNSINEGFIGDTAKK